MSASAAAAAGRKFNVDLIWNLASLAVLGVSGALINLLIARYLDQAALGVFNQVFAIYIVLSQIAVGGVHLSVLMHVSYNQADRRARSQITCAGLLLAGGLSLVVCGAAAALHGVTAAVLNSPDVGRGLLLTIPGLLLFSLNKVLMNTLNGVSHMRAYALFQALRVLMIVAGIAAVIALRWPTVWLAASLSVAEAALFVGVAAYVQARVCPIVSFEAQRTWIGRHFSYGLRGLLAGVFTELNTRVDILLLGLFLADDGPVGVYSFAAILAEGFSQLPLVIRRNVDPPLGRHFAEGRTDDIARDLARVKRLSLLMMLVIGVAAVALYLPAVRLLVPDRGFESSWPPFAILMAGIIVNAYYKPFQGIVLQGGRPGVFTGMVAIVVAANALLNAALIPVLGIAGSAAGTAIAYGVEAGLIVYYARKLFGVKL
ncbi:Polysaccharide biosynthesis protein [Phycisphaerae bacterium RAS1]|nr:Polysaccharide biosynthesis protein [Phycisphaerae bacterium RAS1]